MRTVHVVKGNGPGFEDIFRNSPLFGTKGEIGLTLIPLNEGPRPDTFLFRGQLLGTIKSQHEDRLILIIERPAEQNLYEYLVLQYDYKVRFGDGVIYTSSEFHELPLGDKILSK